MRASSGGLCWVSASPRQTCPTPASRSSWCSTTASGIWPRGARCARSYGICLRVASDFRRRAHRRRERLCAETPERTTETTPEGRAADREALAALEAALDGLPPPQREVFVLYEIEELPMNEIARALGCPLQTAYSRLRLARSAVVEALGAHLNGREDSR